MMRSIMDPVGPEQLQESGKVAKFDFLYSLASTNINQSAPTLVKLYITIRPWTSSIMGLIRPKQYELYALQL